MRSPLAKARYLGSAKSGVEHWYAQRLSAAALVPLGLWFAYGATVLVRADYATAVTWISDPLNAALFILFLSCLYYHALIGLQVVVEDYVPEYGKKIAALAIIRVFIILLALMSVLSILKITLN